MRHLLRVAGLASLSVALLAGCGGNGGPSEDPQTMLEEASAASARVTSGEVDAKLSLDISADELSQEESIEFAGPFVRQGGEVPRFRFAVTLTQLTSNAPPSGASGRLPSQTDFTLTTGVGAGTLQVGGKTYEVAPVVVRRLEQLVASSRTPGGESGSPPNLDLAGWFIEPSNEGTEQIGGGEVEHISGAADVAQIAGDLSVLTEGLGVDQAFELDGIGQFFDEATIDLYVGSEDQVPRRVMLALRWSGSLEGGEPFDGAIDVSINLSGIDEPHEIEMPDAALPLREESIDELPARLSGLGEFLAGSPSTDR